MTIRTHSIPPRSSRLHNTNCRRNIITQETSRRVKQTQRDETTIKSKVVPVWAVKAYGGRGVEVELQSLQTSALDGGKWTASGSNRITPLKGLRYPLNRRFREPHNMSGRFGERETHVLTLPTRIRTPDRPVRSIVTVPTALPWPPRNDANFKTFYHRACLKTQHEHIHKHNDRIAVVLHWCGTHCEGITKTGGQQGTDLDQERDK